MAKPDTGFFSWTARRVNLAAERHETGPVESYGFSDVLTIECPSSPASRPSRLVVCHDDEDEVDYVALILGDTAGNDDVPVHAVHEEQLLLEGERSNAPVEILVGVPDDRDLRVQQRELDRQICTGGPLRTMLECSGARSVIVGWYGSRT